MTDSLLHQHPVSSSALRTRLRDRHRLRRLDRLGARLARLDSVDDILRRAAARLEAGWVQDAWFTSIDADGVRLHVGTLRAEDGRSSEQACLVAAIAIESLPGSVTGPIASRAIGATWNVLHGGGAGSDLAVPPGVTASRAYDLVRWNDAPDRRRGDVLALLDSSRSAVARSTTRAQEDLARV